MQKVYFVVAHYLTQKDNVTSYHRRIVNWANSIDAAYFLRNDDRLQIVYSTALGNDAQEIDYVVSECIINLDTLD